MRRQTGPSAFSALPLLLLLVLVGCEGSLGTTEGLVLDDADDDGYTVEAGDCDDHRSDVKPGGVEVCGDGADQDCNGSDQECTAGDDDGDGITSMAGDCNDSDPNISPNETEAPYNGKDDDCDVETPDDDLDGDGYPRVVDCGDDNPAHHPGVAEVPYDGVDQDCSGEDLSDRDEDGYEGGTGGDDCNDLDNNVNPDATETYYDGVDQDCSGGSDFDVDGDGEDSFLHNGGPDCVDDDEELTGCGGSADTAAPSCLGIRESNGALGDGMYWIDPENNNGAPFQAYCDMTTDGGGYTFYKYEHAYWQNAREAEHQCAELGMQLFIPRTEAHLASALAVSQNAAAGGSAGLEYLELMGVYPLVEGARCDNMPLNSDNEECDWRASDGGMFFISDRTDVWEPDGDNSLGGSLNFSWTEDGLEWYWDSPQPGAFGWRWMCDVGDKQPSPARSCLQIKDENPSAADGNYVIKPSETGPSFEVFCDMTTDGGGWTLVGKGRQGWQWTNAGRGTSEEILDKDDFAVAYLDNMTVMAILGKPLNQATDGLRIYRKEPNQEIRWRYTAATTFTWLFDTEIHDVEYELNGMEPVLAHTQNSQITGNDDTRLFTFAWDGHNFEQGFAIGNEGPNAQTGWMYTNEGHSIPHALVYVRE